VTASWDTTARVWDAATGKPIGEPLRHEGPVNAASFSADGTRIVTASADDTARIWDVSVGSDDDVAWLPDLAEAVGGYRVNEFGAVERLPDQVRMLQNLRDRVRWYRAGMRPAPAFLAWFLDDPFMRTISPISEVTIADYVRERLSSGTQSARDEAARAFPGYPLFRR
jgi:WD40 repeat protein